ncbi:NUDIX hydrolase [soil metagenome]
MTVPITDPIAANPPRVAATVLLLRDDPFEVLMVRRRRGGTFSNALVFPGGVIEDADRDQSWLELATGAAGLDVDDRAIRIGALRETFEEAALLVARTPDGRPAPAGPPDDGTPFDELVRRRGVLLALEELHPFGHWITPAVETRRFDTHFLLCRAPQGQLPRQDDGETVAFEWIAPGHAAEHADERSIIFPTLMNLRRLAESDTVASALEAAEARAPFTVEPVIHRDGDHHVITIPAEAGYGVTEILAPARSMGSAAPS